MLDMAESRGLQDTVTTNVRVLMAVHGIRQTELADQLGWDRTLMSDRLRGKRGWKIEDLAELASRFNVPPGALLGTTAEVVAAAGPTPNAVNGSVTRWYLPPEHYRITASAQVIDFVTARRMRDQGVALSDAPNGFIVRHVG